MEEGNNKRMETLQGTKGRGGCMPFSGFIFGIFSMLDRNKRKKKINKLLESMCLDKDSSVEEMRDFYTYYGKTSELEVDNRIKELVNSEKLDEGNLKEIIEKKFKEFFNFLKLNKKIEESELFDSIEEYYFDNYGNYSQYDKGYEKLVEYFYSKDDAEDNELAEQIGKNFELFFGNVLGLLSGNENMLVDIKKHYNDKYGSLLEYERGYNRFVEFCYSDRSIIEMLEKTGKLDIGVFDLDLDCVFDNIINSIKYPLVKTNPDSGENSVLRDNLGFISSYVAYLKCVNDGVFKAKKLEVEKMQDMYRSAMQMKSFVDESLDKGNNIIKNDNDVYDLEKISKDLERDLIFMRKQWSGYVGA